MILNSEIYNRAINLIDDPNISSLYAYDIISFQKTMYKFLQNGVSIITAPVSVCTLLASQVSPEGKLEEFQGTGGKEYKLSTQPISGSEIKAFINKERTLDFEFDVETNTAIFSQTIDEGSTCAVEWYYAGGFDGDFSIIRNYPQSSLLERIKDLLARALVVAWSDKQKEFLLDIRNIMTDTDFKQHAPSTLLDAKIRWNKNLRDDIFNLQNKLDWDLRNRNRSFYGY